MCAFLGVLRQLCPYSISTRRKANPLGSGISTCSVLQENHKEDGYGAPDVSSEQAEPFSEGEAVQGTLSLLQAGRDFIRQNVVKGAVRFLASRNGKSLQLRGPAMPL